ncbi:MAG: hypothetical protein V7745_08235 [Pseudomonadales bacterium]
MGKFTSHAEPVTPHQLELLVILMEECAEVTQRASKAIRFGLEEVQPGQEYTNAQRLAHEIGDINEVVNRLCSVDVGAIKRFFINNGVKHKSKQLDKYMQTTPVEGANK